VQAINGYLSGVGIDNTNCATASASCSGLREMSQGWTETEDFQAKLQEVFKNVPLDQTQIGDIVNFATTDEYLILAQWNSCFHFNEVKALLSNGRMLVLMSLEHLIIGLATKKKFRRSQSTFLLFF
tara:strand:+ start:2937 stop:3314 length:378 start_codon:yes stop_codon:yes gene_type:complete